MPATATHIIETSDNRLFAVRETGDENLANIWFGTAVKRVSKGFAPKNGARETVVRKAASRVVANLNVGG